MDQWEIDSAATHTNDLGCYPDHRAQEVMRRHGLIHDKRAKLVKIKFYTFLITYLDKHSFLDKK